MMTEILAKRIFRQAIVVVLMVSLIFPMILVSPGGVAQAAGEDEFDLIRERYEFLMTGGTDFDPADPQLAYRIDLIESAGQARWDSMIDASDPVTVTEATYLWEDAANPDSGGHVYNSFIYLKNMALAYATQGSELEGNTELRDDILGGLDWMVANTYSTERDVLPTNWWEWEIGAPQQFLDAIVIMYDDLNQDQIDAYMASISHYSPTVDYFLPNWGKTTGANRVWKASIVALQGIIMKSAERIQEGRTGMDPVLEYVTSGDGFYEDGSFIQHAAIPSNGSYGAELYTLLPNMMYTFEGSTWEFSQEHKDRMFSWTFDSFIPFVYNGAFMDMVRGRSITRPNEFDFRKGHEFTRNLVLVAEFAPPALSAEMKAIAKHYIETNDQWEFFEKNPFLYNLVLGQAIVQDASIVAKEHESYSHIFAMMDRVVHHRPDYAFGISMHSERVYRYESINNENKKGWYTGDGMTYMYNGDRSQYVGNFWPTVNPYRLPGTTVDTSARANASGQQQTNGVSWVGGSELVGKYSSVGMEIDAFEKSLTGVKSWFLFDEEMVALGAGITSTDNTTIETTVEQRKLNEAGDNAFTVNGAVYGSAPENYGNLSEINWAHLAGSVPGSDIGYYFPGNADIKALRDVRSGNWNEVGSSSGAAAASYLTMYYDHGENPADASYAYAILPNKSAAETAAYNAAPKIEVLVNTEDVQAVKQTALGITGANFWTQGIAGDIKTFHPASVMMQEDADNEKLTLAVSDPTQKQEKVVVEIKKEGVDIVEMDDEITVLHMTPTLMLEVDVADSMGQSFELELTYNPVAEPDFIPPNLEELEAVELTADTSTLNRGAATQLTLHATNLGGNPANMADADIVYKSSNPAVLSVNNEGLVTAVSTGTATVTVETTLGSIMKEDFVELDVVLNDGEFLYNINDSDFTFHGTWHQSTGEGKYLGDDHYSTETDAYFEAVFNGAQVSVITSTAAHHGQMSVSIDGGEEVIVDTYSNPRSNEHKVWSSPNLGYGTHTIKIRVTGEKNASSSGTVIAADQLQIVALKDKAMESTHEATDDTFVRGKQDDANNHSIVNYGGNTTLNVANNSHEGWMRRSFFKFDLSDAEDEFERVVLRVFAGPTNDSYTGVTSFKVLAVESDDWDESTMTWIDQVEMGDVIAVASNVTTPDKLIELDITSYVREQLADGDHLISVAVIQDSEPQLLRIRSKEHADVPTRPKLVVHTTLPNLAPVFDSVAPVHTRSGQFVSFSVHASDPEFDALDYSAMNLPSGATFDPDSGLFRWTAGSAGTYIVQFVARDIHGMAGSLDVTINVASSGSNPSSGNGDDEDDDEPTSTPATDEPEPVVDQEDGTLRRSVKPDSSGKASAKIEIDALEQAVSQALEGKLIVTIELDGEASSVDVSLPVEELKQAVEDGTVESLTINTGLASVTLSKQQLAALTTSGAGDVQLIVARVDTASLPRDVSERIGDYPVYDFQLSNANGAVTSFASSRAVIVAMDYMLKPGENPATLVVYFIDDEGQLVVQRNVRFDESTGQIIFYPKHFSKYAAANVPVAFEDIDSVMWAKSSIEALAAREIVKGVSATSFDPSDKITRAQFVQMLIGALDVSIATGGHTFTDVSEGEWYYDAIMTAAQLGIAKGQGDGSFGVDEEITRQDMAVLTYRAALLAGAVSEGEQEPSFADAAWIADYAAEAVASMEAAGLINGQGDGRFAPLASTTRSEAAVILYRLLNSM